MCRFGDGPESGSSIIDGAPDIYSFRRNLNNTTAIVPFRSKSIAGDGSTKTDARQYGAISQQRPHVAERPWK